MSQYANLYIHRLPIVTSKIKRSLRNGLLIAGTLLLIACSNDNQGTVSQAELDALKMELAEQQAFEDIRKLFAAYGRTLDERDYAGFAELYADDAEYGGGGGMTAVGPKAIADQLESVISANASGANLHFYSNEMIDVDIESGTATARSRGVFYVEDESGNPMPLMFATYEDDLVLTDDGWKFQRRAVIGDLPGQANEDRYPVRSAE